MSTSIANIAELATSIDKAQSIVITSHLFPDYDAICSSLLLARTIQHNFPKKQVQIVLEDRPKRMESTSDTSDIVTMPILNALDFYQADCVFVLDTNRFDKVTRGEKTELHAFISRHNIQTVVIDHHERNGEDEFAVRVQNPSIPAATQMVYRVCFENLSLQRPPNIEQITMLGITDDSGIFTYSYDDYSDTLKIVSELVQRGATIERAANAMNQLNMEQIAITGELMKNTTAEARYVYSFISDEFMQSIRQGAYDPIDFKAACTAFGNRYISNVTDRKWGFVIYPDPYYSNQEYRASFRSRADSEMDITTIAKLLGSNGGHNHAAGANIKASNINVALQKVQHAILALC